MIIFKFCQFRINSSSRLIPESVRWLESKDDLNKVRTMLNDIATTNRTSSKKIQALVEHESCTNVSRYLKYNNVSLKKKKHYNFI